MTDLAALEKKIEDSGLKKTFIAEQLGITRQSFFNKLKGITDFRIEEMFKICSILNFSNSERDTIFFKQ